MKCETLGLQVAGTLFGLMALAQVARLVIRPEVVVSGHLVPLWPSGLAAVLLGGMSAWMWRLSCPCNK